MQRIIRRIQDSATIHLEDYGNRLFSKSRAKRINNTDFTIISNNCWGGHVYRRYGLEYLSPTVGLYFFSEDYIHLLGDLSYYLHLPLRFIKCEESKHYMDLKQRGQCNVPIGLLGDDIEIVFLHYESESEAYTKWTRRCERVNYDNLIVKHSQMNHCTDAHLFAFDKMDFRKKVAFVSPSFSGKIACAVPVKKYADEERVLDDTTYFSEHIDLDVLINS